MITSETKLLENTKVALSWVTEIPFPGFLHPTGSSPAFEATQPHIQCGQGLIQQE
jgi:hypothetical protein